VSEWGSAYDAEMSAISRELRRIRLKWLAGTVAFLLFFLWLYFTGGPWKVALTTFAVTYVVSYVLTGYLHGARVRSK
jgi:hypothetical protein